MMPMNLGLGLGLGSIATSQRPTPTNPLCDAIKRLLCVSAKEKGHAYLIAPHIVYRGPKDAQLLDGVVIEKDGKVPNKKKLETFKVADLTEIAVTGTAFTPEAGFDPSRPKYDGKTICVVEIV